VDKKRRINESSKERSKGRYENNTFQMPFKYMLVPQGSIQFTHSPNSREKRRHRESCEDYSVIKKKGTRTISCSHIFIVVTMSATYLLSNK